MEQLSLSIKPKIYPPKKQGLHSSAYRVQVGGWVLDKGVKKMTLEMDASKKPKLTIEADVDYMDIDAIYGLDLELIDTSGQEIKALSPDQVAEIAEYRKLKHSDYSYNELKREVGKQKKQLMVLQVALISIFSALLIHFIYQGFN